ncbi:MAG: hypothetical protein ABSD64_03670 [Terriglobales bacterium]|jgi:hypothetical protein
MSFHNWLELAFVVWGFVATILVIAERIYRDKSPGARAIQYAVAVNILPLVGFLALECKLSSEGVGTILGVIIGYTLPGVLKHGPWGGSKSKPSSTIKAG